MPPVKILQEKDFTSTSQFPSYAKFEFDQFNPVQSAAFEIFDKDCNALIASTTGSGKTVIAEMFIANEVRKRGGKAAYIAPMRALAKEKIDDWTSKSHHFSDLNISICTGDFRLTNERKKELEKADIVILTSEMLNSRIRNYKSEKNDWLKEIKTLVLDEAHILTVPGRGDHIEVGLMKFCDIVDKPRLVGLSATMPNVKEISEWMAYSLTGQETYLLESKYRPCPLGIHYEEYQDSTTYDINEEGKIQAALNVLDDYPDDKFLMFVHTKRTGDALKKEILKQKIDAEFHSADLTADQRVKLETRFKKGDLRVLIATSTLAWGCYKFGSQIKMGDKSLKDIADVEVGDEVLSMVEKGFASRKVLKTKIFEHDSSFKVILESGYTCEVTKDHLFYSFGDWVEICNLIEGDSIGILQDECFAWSKIVKIEKSNGGYFKEIEVDGEHNYVGEGMISHNCNTPARRVVIVGVHRGLKEVDTYDIWQECGRAGRPGFDVRGDAYILLPKKKDDFDRHKQRIETPQNIQSRLLDYIGTEENPHYKTLAFHLISEIHHGSVSNLEELHSWYKKSLAYFQSNDLREDVIDKTLDLLIKCGAVKITDGNYEATMVGKISSMFYYSPFDVADLKRNFAALFNSNYQDNDMALALALSNVDTVRMGIVSRAEKEEMGAWSGKVKKIFGDRFMDTAIKGGYIYFCLLNGMNLGVFSAQARTLQADFPRLGTVLNALDSMNCKWGQKKFIDKLNLRVSYGVRSDRAHLCELPDVGKVRAEKLWASGIRTFEDIVKNKAKLKTILNLKEDKVNIIVDSAKERQYGG